GGGDRIVGHLEHGGVGCWHGPFWRPIFAGKTPAPRVGGESAGAGLSGFWGRGKGGGGGKGTVLGSRIHAVEKELIAPALIGHLHFERIAPGIRLGEAKGEDLVAAGCRRQIAELLLFIPPHQDRISADRKVPGEKRPHARPFPANAD